MSGGQIETPRGWRADTGQNCNAAGTDRIAKPKGKCHNRIATFTVYNAGEPAFTVHVTGRVLWALTRLIAAGRHGCTPIEQPAPRWSAYIRELRLLGVDIETIREPHGGNYPGYHGRYVLRSKVRGGVA